jgi:ketosteroid isomerase-like protein
MNRIANLKNLRRGALLLALSVGSITSLEAQPKPSQAESEKLFQTVSALDTALFDAFNRCDLAKLESFVTDDLEFYHDQDGLSRGKKTFLEAIQKNICGKVRRDLVAGSLEVYPLKTYGALETGAHRFCDSRKMAHCGEKDSGIAKFAMLWQQREGGWKLMRVISYDHVSSE